MFTSVSVGTAHACGVRPDGSVTCWGADNYGEATPPAGTFVSLDAGDFHTCGMRADLSVTCWGEDTLGQATPP
jgi:Regulator of chromosome condensation (RCC1) repeat